METATTGPVTDRNEEEEGSAIETTASRGVDFKHSFSSRWAIVFLAGLTMCGSHYARDAVGALERQMETDLHITSDQYKMINSVYFIPSIFAPILAGIFTVYLGGAEKCLLYSVISSSVGHIIFSLGIQFNSIGMIYTGRSIAGENRSFRKRCLAVPTRVPKVSSFFDFLQLLLLTGFMYEIIDSVPIVVLAPLFQTKWGLIVGLLNGFIRMGSVMNFLISPMVYSSRSVKSALWLATAFASCTTLFALLICVLSKAPTAADSAKGTYEELMEACDEPDDESTLYSIATGDVPSCNNHNEDDNPITRKLVGSSLVSDETRIRAVSTDSHRSSGDDFTLVVKLSDASGRSVSDITRSVLSTSSPIEGEVLDYAEKIVNNSTEPITSVTQQSKTFQDGSNSKYNLSVVGKFATSMASALPLRLFPFEYYMFLCSGAFLYGSMVPFWFLGSKFLQDHYNLSIGSADALLLLPEGMIAIVSVPIGHLLDTYCRGMKSRLRMLAVSCMFLPASYLMLAHGFRVRNTDENADMNSKSTAEIFIPPAFSMFAIGFAYAISNSLYWSTVMDILPKGPHFSAANGLIASCLNILPSVVPPFLVLISSIISKSDRLRYLFPLYLLSALGCCAAIFAFLATVDHELLFSSRGIRKSGSIALIRQTK